MAWWPTFGSACGGGVPDGVCGGGALRAKAALQDRVGPGVRWHEYREGGELGGYGNVVVAIVACDGREYAAEFRMGRFGCEVGPERTLRACAEQGADDDAPDERSQERRPAGAERVIEGHRDIEALAACGSSLAVGADRGSIGAWALTLSSGAARACFRRRDGRREDGAQLV